MNSENQAKERVTTPTARLNMGKFGRDAAVFFRGFLDNPRMVASVVQSSDSTINALLEPVDWQACQLFVEYGPGVGTFTRPILERLPAHGKLLVIDTNPRFIEHLEHTIIDPRFQAVLGSAADVSSFVAATGENAADYVLSGLPFSALSQDEGRHIVAKTHDVLREGGAFMTYQFRASARVLTAERFAKVDTGLALWNIPPCLLTWGWKRTKPG